MNRCWWPPAVNGSEASVQDTDRPTHSITDHNTQAHPHTYQQKEEVHSKHQACRGNHTPACPHRQLKTDKGISTEGESSFHVQVYNLIMGWHHEGHYIAYTSQIMGTWSGLERRKCILLLMISAHIICHWKCIASLPPHTHTHACTFQGPSSLLLPSIITSGRPPTPVILQGRGRQWQGMPH